MFNRNNRNTKQGEASNEPQKYDRATVLRQMGDFQFRIADALTGCMIFGATGSGKTSGPGVYLALAYLAFGFGGLILCAKPEERAFWERLAALTGRSDDVIVVNAAAETWRFNFMRWTADRASKNGLTLAIVSLLEAISQAVTGSAGSGSGESQFWTDSLRLLITSAVDLCLFAGLPVSLPNLHEIITSAPLSLEEVESEKWQRESFAWAAMKAAAARKDALDMQELADLKECVTYFSRTFPSTSDRTRSIFLMMAAQLMRPLTTRPLRRLFCEDTTWTPEDCFAGKLVIIDLPTQQFLLTGRVAAYVAKVCFQNAVMAREQPPPGQNLRPVFWWADECTAFLGRSDTTFASVCRSSACCICLLSQNREGMRLALGSDDATDSLLANLQCRFFCQNSGETNEHAARLLGERWVNVNSSGYSFSSKGDGGGHRETAEQRRFYVEPSRFATLKRGGSINNFEVECFVYNGGVQYDLYDPTTRQTEKVPYAHLTLQQENRQ